MDDYGDEQTFEVIECKEEETTTRDPTSDPTQQPTSVPSTSRPSTSNPSTSNPSTSSPSTSSPSILNPLVFTSTSEVILTDKSQGTTFALFSYLYMFSMISLLFIMA